MRRSGRESEATAAHSPRPASESPCADRPPPSSSCSSRPSASIVPSAAAATGDPKVVIIVGATHGATAGYRADADRAYAEAIKYTPNVVKVYSPNATWAKVKAAVVGASIVIYLGHGNGWPSPYTYDAKYTTKDGFGLNATAGAGDYNNKYYGEPYVSTLDLAPNAVVILNHLCYASGNSRAGQPGADGHRRPPARRQLRRRLPEGRRVGGHRRRSRRIRGVHPGTVHDPSVGRGHVADRARSERPRGQLPVRPDARDARSTRTRSRRRAASTARSRSRPWASRPMRSSSGGYGDTSVNPTSLVVPGNAAVTTDGAGVYGDLDSTAGPDHDAPGRHAAARRRAAHPAVRRGRHPGRGRRDRRPVDRRLHARQRPRGARQHRPGRPGPRPRRRVLAQRRRTARRRVAARPVHRIGRLDAEDPRRRRPRAVLDDRDRLHVPGRLGRQGRRAIPSRMAPTR